MDVGAEPPNMKIIGGGFKIEVCQSLEDRDTLVCMRSVYRRSFYSVGAGRLNKCDQKPTTMPKIRIPVAIIRTVKGFIFTDRCTHEGGLFLFWTSLIEDLSPGLVVVVWTKYHCKDFNFKFQPTSSYRSNKWIAVAVLAISTVHLMLQEKILTRGVSTP